MIVPDHYRELGVPRFAAPSVVRAAFISFIQRHHPDARGAKPDDPRISRVLEAYWTLRHQDRRSAYDAKLRAQDAASHARRQAARFAGHARTPRPRRRRFANRWLFVTSILLVVAMVVWANRHHSAVIKSVTAVADRLQPDGSDPNSKPTLAVLQRAIRDYPTMQAQIGATGIVGYLRQCFGTLGWSQSPELFDYCAAIDDLAARDFADERSALGSFFRTETRLARIDAVNALPADPRQQRWEAISAFVAAQYSTTAR